MDHVSHSSPHSFAKLMELAAAGDQHAQTRLCEEYEPKVRIVARVLLGPALRSHFDSMDLVQSVHRSLLVGMRNQKFDISSPEKLIALASTIARRKIARKWRVAQRQIRPVSRSNDSGDVADLLLSLSSPAAGPASIAEFNEQLEQLNQSLSETERKMLSMRLEGYTAPEVAETLGIQPVALRVRWTRLRQRLQEAGVLTDWI